MLRHDNLMAMNNNKTDYRSVDFGVIHRLDSGFFHDKHIEVSFFI